MRVIFSDIDGVLPTNVNVFFVDLASENCLKKLVDDIEAQ